MITQQSIDASRERQKLQEVEENRKYSQLRQEAEILANQRTQERLGAEQDEERRLYNASREYREQNEGLLIEYLAMIPEEGKFTAFERYYRENIPIEIYNIITRGRFRGEELPLVEVKRVAKDLARRGTSSELRKAAKLCEILGETKENERLLGKAQEKEMNERTSAMNENHPFLDDY